MKHLPNALTIVRILVTPVVIILLYGNELPGIAIALVLFLIGAASDYLDGKIARKFEARSELGQALDPLADKVLVLGTFVMLCVIVPEFVPWWGVALIGLRDISVTWMRSQSRVSSGGFTLPVAQRKTAIQIAYLSGILVLLTFEKLEGTAGGWARWVLDTPIPLAAFLLVVAFTLWTGWIYLFREKRTG